MGVKERRAESSAVRYLVYSFNERRGNIVYGIRKNTRDTNLRFVVRVFRVRNVTVVDFIEITRAELNSLIY